MMRLADAAAHSLLHSYFWTDILLQKSSLPMLTAGYAGKGQSRAFSISTRYGLGEFLRDSQATVSWCKNEGRATTIKLSGISRFPHASWSMSFPREGFGGARLMGFPCFKSQKGKEGLVQRKDNGVFCCFFLYVLSCVDT